MKKVDKTILEEAANRLLFTMSEEQYDTLLDEFSILLKQMETLGEVQDLDAYDPMTFPFSCETSYLREDEPMTPLSQEEALKNAGNVQDGQIKLPKVVQ